ncbi:hypothetical protein TEQG_02899 [Trichophyton equinum CBS 127.97]|uniref:Uncharacterized protein n=1 Tax=Trichophyton equinum (strain ATCC MYA-4606 / CBS 127.97) TaxID=559882 RepID=F2PPP7_TRIEC|nr:hypothetical protein TEQG_02899 [Trichophyton equinum CBS 127.97]
MCDAANPLAPQTSEQRGFLCREFVGKLGIPDSIIFGYRKNRYHLQFWRKPTRSEELIGGTHFQPRAWVPYHGGKVVPLATPSEDNLGGESVPARPSSLT